MKTIIEGKEYDLEPLVTAVRQTIWIGVATSGIYNTITLNVGDTYQCTITHDKATGDWILTNGQVRTECPRGLKSSRAKACSACIGCCINRPIAQPTYSQRTPSSPTLLNGHPIPTEGVPLHEGDAISVNLNQNTVL